MMLNVVLDGNPLDEDDGNLLLKMFLMLDEFINDVNLMFYKQLRSTREGNISEGQSNYEKCVFQGIHEIVKEKARMHADKYVTSRVWDFALQNQNTKGHYHGIDPLY